MDKMKVFPLNQYKEHKQQWRAFIKQTYPDTKKCQEFPQGIGYFYKIKSLFLSEMKRKDI